MIWQGWSLGQVALAIGAGSVGIALLYLLREHRRQIEVAYSALWRRVIEQQDARRPWTRWRRLLSWLLQVLIWIALVLSLGDPESAEEYQSTLHRLVIVDGSATMKGPAYSTSDVATHSTRIADARAWMDREIETLGPRDEFAWIWAGATPDLQLPWTPREAIDPKSIHFPDARASGAPLLAAIDLARSLSASEGRYEIILISDGNWTQSEFEAIETCVDSAIDCKIVRTDGPDTSIGILNFGAQRRLRDQRYAHVALTVRNASEVDRAVEVHLMSGERTMERKTVNVAPRSDLDVQWNAVEAPHAILEARLHSADEQSSSDERAWSVIAPLQPIEIVLIHESRDLFLEAALLSLDEHVQVSAIAPNSLDSHAALLSRANLIVVDVLDQSDLKLPFGHAPVLYFSSAAREPVAIPMLDQARWLARPRITDQNNSHPLVQGIVWKDVNVRRSRVLSLSPSDEWLLRELDQNIAAFRPPRGDSSAWVIIGFDPRESDLPLRNAFPLLIANAVDYFAKPAVHWQRSFRTGVRERMDIQTLAPRWVGSHTFILESQSEGIGAARYTSSDGNYIDVLVDDPGIWTLAPAEIPQEKLSIAFNAVPPGLEHVPTSSSKRLFADARRHVPHAPETSAFALWQLLLLLAMSMLAFEWWTYHRRMTL